MKRSFLAACLALAAAAPATQPARSFQAAADDPASSTAPKRRAASVPRTSVDGTPFPDVTATYWWASAKLGVIGPILGTVPEESGVKILSLTSEGGSALRARQMITKVGLTAPGYDWLTTQFGGSSFVLLKLTGGRISGVCLIDTIEAASWKAKARSIAKAGVVDDLGFKVGPVLYRVSYGGQWTKRIEGHNNPFGNSTPATESQHPAAMAVEIDAWDWAMATSCRTKAFFDSCIAGKVETGMSRLEAYLAMRKYDLKRIVDPKDKSNEAWVWTESAKAERKYKDELGTTADSEAALKKKPLARAKIEKGLIVDFEWVVGE